MFEERLRELMQDANDAKSKASENEGAFVARRWAVLHTELEKALAYYIAYLKPKNLEDD